MTNKQPTTPDAELNQLKAVAERRFNEIAQQIQRFLNSKPLSTYSKIRWVLTPLDLKGPRFGAEETCINEKAVLELSEDLLVKHAEYLESVLWREAYLLHLPDSVRAVLRAADIGLYCYYRYGLNTRKQRQHFLRVWEAASPPIQYAFYRYYPTGGFAYFDNIVDGRFLQIVKQWFRPFTQLSTPLTEDAYTAYLERWMMNHHRILKPIELKVLQGLYNKPTASQIELAESLGLKQPTVSRIIKVLAEKHLMRFFVIENFPMLGLQPIAALFSSPSSKIRKRLGELASEIRYTLAIHEVQNQIRLLFVIPFRRITRFRQWVMQIAAALDLPSPKILRLMERVVSRNFSLYKPKKNGWPLNFEAQLGNIERLFHEDWTQQLPPMRSFQFSSHEEKKHIRLRPEDFIYMRRASDAFLVTHRAKFYEAGEARKSGSSDLTYRRRVAYLQKNKIMSPPLGIGLFHFGLDALVSFIITNPQVEAQTILRAFQLLPYVSGNIFDDGSIDVALLLPKESAVNVETSLSDSLRNIASDVTSNINPAWETYGWIIRPPVSPDNYDFNNGSWIWVKDTLPNISPSSN